MRFRIWDSCKLVAAASRLYAAALEIHRAPAGHSHRRTVGEAWRHQGRSASRRGAPRCHQLRVWRVPSPARCGSHRARRRGSIRGFVGARSNDRAPTRRCCLFAAARGWDRGRISGSCGRGGAATTSAIAQVPDRRTPPSDARGRRPRYPPCGRHGRPFPVGKETSAPLGRGSSGMEVASARRPRGDSCCRVVVLWASGDDCVDGPLSFFVPPLSFPLATRLTIGCCEDRAASVLSSGPTASPALVALTGPEL